MKWRDGVYCVCPFCSAPRSAGDFIPSYTIKVQGTDNKPQERDVKARKHYYKCGTSIIEAENQNHNNKLDIQYLVPTSLCAAALVTVGKALSMVATEYDLSTITDFDTCEAVAEQTANLTALAIYRHVKDNSLLYDNFRLPPIPLMDHHCKLVAESLTKK